MTIFERAQDLINDATFQHVEKTYRSTQGIFIFDTLEESRIANFISDFEVICKSPHSTKFRIADTKFLCATTVLKRPFISIRPYDSDTFAIKIRSELLMTYPQHSPHIRLQYYDKKSKKFEYFINYEFEYLTHDDKCITLAVNNCDREKTIQIPNHRDDEECKIRAIALEYAQPFTGSLFNSSTSSMHFDINYLPLCWMGFSRAPMIIVVLEGSDDEITIRYKRGQLSELSHEIYKRFFHKKIITTKIGSEMLAIADGKGFFLKSL